MKYKIMKKWVKALRSGDYKQGRENLCEDNEYCCLGVLCDLASKEDVCEKSDNFDGIISYDGNLLVRRSVLEVGSSGSFGLQAIENPIEWLFGE